MEFPKKCPYCGKDIIKKETKTFRFNKNLALETHECFHCLQSFLVIYKYQALPNGGGHRELIHCYPEPQQEEIPERVEKLSPRAAKAFKDAIRVKNLGLDKLAGAGLRLALEYLAWDYLITVKNYPEKKLKDLKLKGLIDEMNCNFYSSVCTELIRKFGNDCIHIRQMLDFSVDEVIEIFNSLFSIINGELGILEANNRLKKKF